MRRLAHAGCRGRTLLVAIDNDPRVAVFIAYDNEASRARAALGYLFWRLRTSFSALAIALRPVWPA
jgi:hypothetical protein